MPPKLSQSSQKPPKPEIKETKEVTPPPEFEHAADDIERELNRNRLGSFKVMIKHMDFQWTDRANRPVDSGAKLQRLYNSMKTGIHRREGKHHMSGIVTKETLEKSIFHPSEVTNEGRPKAVKFSEVKEFNMNAEYPIVIFPGSKAKVASKIEMQSGQHRMAVLKSFYKDNEGEHYWFVTLYDSKFHFR